MLLRRRSIFSRGSLLNASPRCAVARASPAVANAVRPSPRARRLLVACSIGFAACSAAVADACRSVARVTRATDAARRALARASFAFSDTRRSVARVRFGLVRVSRIVVHVSFALVCARCALARVNRALARVSRGLARALLSVGELFPHFAFRLGNYCLSGQATRAVSTFTSPKNLSLHSSYERSRNPPLRHVWPRPNFWHRQHR